MKIGTVVEAHNSVLFDVLCNDETVRAVQLLDRLNGEMYANAKILVDDLVLVVEVPGLLFSPSMSESSASDSVSHITLGLVPPSLWHEIADYDGLVRP